MKTIEGGCLCGAIRYQFSCQPVKTLICHCKHCQLQTGSAFSVVVGIRRGTLKLTKGQSRVFYDTDDNGLVVSRHFCPDCGSPIMSDTEAEPGIVFIKAGTLDDTSWLSPETQVWAESAQPWINAEKSIPSFQREPIAQEA